MSFINRLKKTVKLLLIGGTTLAASSCNDTKSDVPEGYPTPFNVAVTAMTITGKGNTPEIDSTYFSIDLDRGVIFNADSLPVGTQIDKLVPTFTYSSYVTKAIIKMEGGTTRTGEVDYTTTKTDSIDFTGKVTLTLSVEDENISRTYLVKVNVHKEKSDSLVWGDRAHAALPSRLASPKNQKSVSFKSSVVSIIQENDGSFTLASSSNLYDNQWSRKSIALPFEPEIRSLTASSDALYILDKSKQLFSSTDGENWTATGEKWDVIIGAYKNSALGLKSENGALYYAQFPMLDLNVEPVDAEFPLNGGSNFVTISNKWTTSPVGFFVGGTLANGTLSRATWAFDGANWVNLSQSDLPQVKGASIIPYYGFRFSSAGATTPTEYPVWMVMGGTLNDGSLNRTMYISYDNGVNWSKASAFMQLPKEIPTMTACDNLVMETRLQTKLSDYWTPATRKGEVSVENNIISWDCPYIYMIGGYQADGNLCNSIWRGSLARFTFTPIF